MRVKLHLNKHAFVLMCPSDDNEKYIMNIRDISLMIPKGLLSDKVAMSIEKRLKEHRAVINFTRTVMIDYPIYAGNPHFVKVHNNIAQYISTFIR